MKANRAAGEQNTVIVEGWVLVSLLSCLHPQIFDKSLCPQTLAGCHMTCSEEEAEEEQQGTVKSRQESLNHVF